MFDAFHLALIAPNKKRRLCCRTRTCLCELRSESPTAASSCEGAKHISAALRAEWRLVTWQLGNLATCLRTGNLNSHWMIIMPGGKMEVADKEPPRPALP